MRCVLDQIGAGKQGGENESRVRDERKLLQPGHGKVDGVRCVLDQIGAGHKRSENVACSFNR